MTYVLMEVMPVKTPGSQCRIEVLQVFVDFVEDKITKTEVSPYKPATLPRLPPPSSPLAATTDAAFCLLNPYPNPHPHPHPNPHPNPNPNPHPNPNPNPP